VISTAIVDSGPLIAVANRADPAHQSCLEALRSPNHRIVIPVLCIAEAAYLIGSRHGPRAEALFLRGLRDFDVQSPGPEDWSRMADLVARYGDFPLGATDASVVLLAERNKTDLIVTLDYRHFSAVRPRHCERFRLLPEIGVPY
jgi:uncharacterized protein